MLLGQMEMLKKSSGLMVAFIDFSKAYDRIMEDPRDYGSEWQILVFPPVALCWDIMSGS